MTSKYIFSFSLPGPSFSGGDLCGRSARITHQDRRYQFYEIPDKTAEEYVYKRGSTNGRKRSPVGLPYGEQDYERLGCWSQRRKGVDRIKSAEAVTTEVKTSTFAVLRKKLLRKNRECDRAAKKASQRSRCPEPRSSEELQVKTYYWVRRNRGLWQALVEDYVRGGQSLDSEPFRASLEIFTRLAPFIGIGICTWLDYAVNFNQELQQSANARIEAERQVDAVYGPHGHGSTMNNVEKEEHAVDAQTVDDPMEGPIYDDPMDGSCAKVEKTSILTGVSYARRRLRLLQDPFAKWASAVRRVCHVPRGTSLRLEEYASRRPSIQYALEQDNLSILPAPGAVKLSRTKTQHTFRRPRRFSAMDFDSIFGPVGRLTTPLPGPGVASVPDSAQPMAPMSQAAAQNLPSFTLPAPSHAPTTQPTRAALTSVALPPTSITQNIPTAQAIGPGPAPLPSSQSIPQALSSVETLPGEHKEDVVEERQPPQEAVNGTTELATPPSLPNTGTSTDSSLSVPTPKDTSPLGSTSKPAGLNPPTPKAASPQLPTAPEAVVAPAVQRAAAATPNTSNGAMCDVEAPDSQSPRPAQDSAGLAHGPLTHSSEAGVDPSQIPLPPSPGPVEPWQIPLPASPDAIADPTALPAPPAQGPERSVPAKGKGKKPRSTRKKTRRSPDQGEPSASARATLPQLPATLDAVTAAAVQPPAVANPQTGYQSPVAEPPTPPPPPERQGPVDQERLRISIARHVAAFTYTPTPPIPASEAVNVQLQPNASHPDEPDDEL